MKSSRVLLARLGALFRREKVLGDIDEELRNHLEMETQNHIDRGVAPDEARRLALKSFGDVGRLRDVSYDIRGGGLLETIWQDVQLSLRLLLRHRTFTIVALLTLALGMGVNLSVFTVLNAVLFRALPHIDSDRFVVIESGDYLKGPDQLSGVSPGNFWQMRNEMKTFSEIAGVLGSGFSFRDRNNPETVPAVMVTPEFFRALTAAPVAGRVIEERDTCEGCAPVVVISHRLWMRRFGGDTSIIGRVLPGNDARVIGVMPPDFKYPVNSEVWQPLVDRLQAQDRGSRYFQVYAMLRPGTAIDAARNEIALLSSRLEKDFPRENKNLVFAITPFRERLTRDVRRPLFVLMAAVGMVLLMTCANVANLFLVRLVSRRRDLALSSALGASQWRLVRQILAESAVLCVASTLLGLILALWARKVMLVLLPRNFSHLPIEDRLLLDWRVCLFGVIAMVLSAFFFSVFPAFQVARRDAGDLLRDGRYSTEGRQTHRWRNILVVTQVALALVLLAGAGLLINSFLKLQRTASGFDATNLFGLNLRIPPQLPPDQKVLMIGRLKDAVAAVPEVLAVSVTTSSNVLPYLKFSLNRTDQPGSVDEPVLYDAVSSEYFGNLGISIVAGRNFEGFDTAGSDAIAIVNEKLSKKYFPDENPLGKLVTLNYLGRPQKRRIIGVARDFSQGEQPGRVEPQIFVHVAQQPWFGAALAVRSGSTPAAALRSIQAALWTVDPGHPVSRIQTVEDLLRERLGEPRLYTVLLGVFGLLALVLAAIGLAGLVSYSVSQRTREIGVRMALGARDSDVLRMLLIGGLKLVTAGLLIGLTISLILTRLMKGLLFELSATDPQTFAFAIALLAIVALLSCYFPARRATKVEPVISLRSE